MNKKLWFSIIIVALMLAAFITRQKLAELFSQGREDFPFASSSVVDLQIDVQDRPWIQTRSASQEGLWYLEDGNWQAFDLPEMLKDSGPWHFAFGPRGEIWLAANQGLYVFDGSEWILHPSVENLLQEGFQFAVDANGFAWLGYGGAERSGLVMFDGEAWHELLSDVNVTKVASAPDGRVWIGTDAGDLTIFDRDSVVQTYTIEDYFPTNQFFSSRSIWDIEFDDQGYTWAVSEERIYRFDGEVWKIYTAPDDFLGVSDLAVANNGHLWLAFLIQLAEFDGAHWNPRFDALGYYATATEVSTDSQGKIWLADGDVVRSLDLNSVYFPTIDLVRWERFFSGMGFVFVEASLLIVLFSIWLNLLRQALLTVGFAIFFLFVANFLIFPDHWSSTGKLLDTWPLIDQGLVVLAGGVLGALVNRLLANKKIVRADDLRFAIAGSVVGMAIGLIQVYFFLAGMPLS
ncbi:MAG TPA: hypothetical protein VLK33_04330 [Terriglobales bacterium]|nr:hypothetical protein [Terriglobales bacterium]